jgi:hypothetical protein
LQQNDVSKIVPEERARMQQELGAVKTFEVLGTVSRRGGEFFLCPVKLNTSKGEFHRLFIWHNGKIFDIRELPEGYTLEFANQSKDEFYAEPNDLKIRFTTIDEKPAMIIYAKSGEVTVYQSKE